MSKSFSVLKTNIGNMIQDSSSSMSTNIGVWINNRYRDVISRYEWEELIINQSLTASATVSAYALDADVGNIMFINDVTNGCYLAGNTEQQFYEEHYDTFDDTGTPERYFTKYDVVKAQPASAEKPTVKSSSASDTTQSILLRGISSNAEVYETISLNGTTAVTASNSYTRITGISKSSSTTGFISIMHNNESTLFSLMSRELLESQYRQLHIHPIPTGDIVYHIKAVRRILELSQTYDYPVIDVADTIELGAIADSWRYKRQFAKAQQYEFMYEKSVSDKIFQRLNRPDQINQFIPVVLNRDDGIL